MQLLLELLSDTCISSGESIAGIIDVECEFDEYGILFIPVKRIKGILRGAAEDIDLICDGKYSSYIDNIFGKPGESIPGSMVLENGKLDGYEEILDMVKRGRMSKNYKILFNKELIKDNFTYIRSQTEIGENGVAKENSLRNIRVLKKGLRFLFNLKIDEEYIEFLQEICKMVRHIGVNRTRGLGEVKLSFIENKESIKHGLDNNNKIKISDNRVDYKIKLKEPCILEKDYISGSSILGIFANRYIKLNNIDRKNAHKNKEFIDLFLSYNVIFSNAYLTIKDERLFSTPITFMKEKDSCNRDIYDLCRDDFPEDKKCNSLPYGYGILEDGVFKGINVKRYINYHHRRPKDRSLGRPIEGDGDYYKYVCIKEGTEFKGELVGEKDSLTKLMDLFKDNRLVWIGTSKNAQYGEAEIEFQAHNENRHYIDDNKAFILLTSPMIIRNRFGMYSADKNDLLRELGLEKNQDNIKVYLKTTEVGGFNSKWGLPKEKAIAIKEGSVIVLNNIKADDIYKIVDKSYGERINEGFGRIELIDYNLEDELSFREIDKKNIRELTETDINENKYKYIINNSLNKLFSKKVINLYLSDKDSLGCFKKFILKDNISNNIVNNIIIYLNTSNSFDEFDSQLLNAGKRFSEDKVNSEYSKIKRYLMDEENEKDSSTAIKFNNIKKDDFINSNDSGMIDNIFKSNIGRDFLNNQDQFKLFKIYLTKILTMLKYDKKIREGQRG